MGVLLIINFYYKICFVNGKKKKTKTIEQKK